MEQTNADIEELAYEDELDLERALLHLCEARYMNSHEPVVRSGEVDLQENMDFRTIANNRLIAENRLEAIGLETRWGINNSSVAAMPRDEMDPHPGSIGPIATKYLLVLRIMHDTHRDRLGLGSTIEATVGELVTELITGYGVYEQDPPKKELENTLTELEKAQMVARPSRRGCWRDKETVFYIMPAILQLVDGQTIANFEEYCEEYRKKHCEEDPADGDDAQDTQNEEDQE